MLCIIKKKQKKKRRREEEEESDVYKNSFKFAKIILNVGNLHFSSFTETSVSFF
jgi:hypothetical protein